MSKEGTSSNDGKSGKKSENIFVQIGKMDDRTLAHEIEGMEPGKLGDIKRFTYEQGKGPATKFLEDLGGYTAETLELAEEVKRQAKIGAAHLMAVGKDEQFVGYFIKHPTEPGTHIIALGNGDIYKTEPKRSGLTRRYRDMMENEKIVFPDLSLNLDGTLSDSTAREIIRALGKEKYGVHVSSSSFTQEVNFDYKQWPADGKKRLAAREKEKEIAREAESLIPGLLREANDTRRHGFYDSFEALLENILKNQKPNQPLGDTDSSQGEEKTL